MIAGAEWGIRGLNGNGKNTIKKRNGATTTTKKKLRNTQYCSWDLCHLTEIAIIGLFVYYPS